MHLTEYQRLIYMWSTNAFFIMPFVSFKNSNVDAILDSVPNQIRPSRTPIVITLASLVMPIGDPRDRFFYPTLTLMMDLGCHARAVHWLYWNSRDMVVK